MENNYNYFKKYLQNLNNIVSEENLNTDKILNFKNNKKNIINLTKNFNLLEIKKIKYNEVNLNELINFNEDGNTILHVAIDNADKNILHHLLKICNNLDITNSNDRTLLEYACLKKDSNLISFLQDLGCSMKKHLLFRQSKELNIILNNIDYSLIYKSIMEIENNKAENHFAFLKKYFNNNNFINIDLFIKKLNLLPYLIGQESFNTYLSIIKEELEFTLRKDFLCPANKLEIVLFNLYPFLNLPFNLDISFILKNELYYLIKNIKEKKIILDLIWDKYISQNLYKKDYIGIIIYQLLSEINI
jgi:ankyrin repeat protein